MPDIDALLHEERSFPPISDAQLTPAMHAQLLDSWHADPQQFWGDLGRQELVWTQPFSQVLDDSNAPFYKWYAGGKLNASSNCLDRHLPNKQDDIAINWEAEDGDIVKLTYGELHDLVGKFATTLRDAKLERGDRVIIYMPLVPEVVVAMLACARIGAVHSVVFAGFSAKALADRIQDTGARVVLTADGGFRNGKIIPLKKNVDEALKLAPVDCVFVLPRTGEDVPMLDGRDRKWTYGNAFAEPVEMDANEPLFILYTSGSTGKPKGIVHATGGYLTWARASTRWVFDLRPGDVYWCTADVGWITGHTYLVYGPLMNGAELVMYEGGPMYPANDRWWDIVARHKATILYTAPTAIRALMQCGDDAPARHDLSSLRILGSVGEPINPEAWMWYHTHIGGTHLPIVDTWWQTETGGIILSSLPGVHDQHPGSCGQPLPGLSVSVLGATGMPVTGSGGDLVIDKPWPGLMQGVWGDPQRYQDAYWNKFGGRFEAGDTARRDEDGNFWIMGRADDVLNVSGHRIGTMEVESALVSHPAVAEAAVVGIPDAVTGEALHAFVILQGEADEATLRDHVGTEIGKTARPARIVIAKGLPKTRSGKIMRRILRSIACGEEISQDTSTLEDPSVVAQLQAMQASQV